MDFFSLHLFPPLLEARFRSTYSNVYHHIESQFVMVLPLVFTLIQFLFNILLLNWYNITVLFLWFILFYFVIKNASISINKIHQTVWKVVVSIINFLSIITQVEKGVHFYNYHFSRNIVFVFKKINYIPPSHLGHNFSRHQPSCKCIFPQWPDSLTITSLWTTISISLSPIVHGRVQNMIKNVLVIHNQHICI